MLRMCMLYAVHTGQQVLTLRTGVCAQDNNFIRKGYRIGYSTRDILVSVFTWHNETGNIHSHLLGDATCETAPAIVLDCAVSVVDPSTLEAGSRN
jgi:predicted membrane channel-forming protein YqfA (hemolysin III family)